MPRHKTFIILLITLWLSIPATNMVARLMLPPAFYAYREWEFMTTSGGPGPFKPSTVFQAKIYGDLANMLHIRKFRRYRQQIFTTDAAGFRNPKFAPGTSFPIVALGDSDMAGSSMTDEETFCRVLGNRLSIPVYNYSPASPLAFLADEQFINNPPKLVIWEAIERTITKNFKSYATLPPKARYAKGQSPLQQQQQNLPRLTDIWAKDLYHEIIWVLGGHHEKTIGHIDNDSGMLFYQPGIQTLHTAARQQDINDIVAGIDRIRQLLAARGIDLIFLPLPDKENVYQELLPERLRRPSQPAFLEKLTSQLSEQGVNTVDLYTPFRSAAQAFIHTRQEKDSLYFLDDTHWNGNGVTLAVKETLRKLNNISMISDTSPIRP